MKRLNPLLRPGKRVQLAILGAFAIGVTTFGIATTFDGKAATLNPASSYTPAGYALNWSDEFNGTTLDTTKWTAQFDNYGAGNLELQCNTPRPQNVSVSGGLLRIIALRETIACPGGGTYNYTSGHLNTKGKFAQSMGYYEMRAKLPPGKGFWPAWWMRPAGGDIQSTYTEIDIIEGFDIQGATSTTHWKKPFCGWGCSRYGYVYNKGSSATYSDWHTYGLLWEDRRLAYYFDGVEVFVMGDKNRNGVVDSTELGWGNLAKNQATDPTGQPVFPNPFVDANKMYMRLNLALQSKSDPYESAVDSTSPFPAEYAVDYVRYYQKTAATATATPAPATAAPSPTPTRAPVPGDVNGDYLVNTLDLSTLLSNWDKAHASADLNKDGKVGIIDLSMMLSRWTR